MQARYESYLLDESARADRPVESFHCEYARMWVKVKYVYDLTITDAEKSALSDMLDTC